MMDKETADELMELVQQQFEKQIEELKKTTKDLEPHTPCYEMVNSLKRTFGYIKRTYAKYRSMLYLTVSAGQIDPDDKNQWAINVVTDIDAALGDPSAPETLMTIESSVEDDVVMNMRYIEFDHDDVFMNALESCITSIPDDVLLATNFVNFLDKIKYKMADCRVDRTPAGRMIVMVLCKRQNVIRVRFNIDVPMRNVQKNLEFIHKVQSAPPMQP